MTAPKSPAQYPAEFSQLLLHTADCELPLLLQCASPEAARSLRHSLLCYFRALRTSTLPLHETLAGLANQLILTIADELPDAVSVGHRSATPAAASIRAALQLPPLAQRIASAGQPPLQAPPMLARLLELRAKKDQN